MALSLGHFAMPWLSVEPNEVDLAKFISVLPVMGWRTSRRWRESGSDSWSTLIMADFMVVVARSELEGDVSTNFVSCNGVAESWVDWLASCMV